MILILDEKTYKSLINEAIKGRKKAYTPYSNFKVGAALYTYDHEIIQGCNIESASFTPTICAERTAFSKAVSEGKTKFIAIAIVGGFTDDTLEYCYPCGVCRQVMMDFCDENKFQIIIAKNENEYKVHTLKELLPFGFGPKDLE